MGVHDWCAGPPRARGGRFWWGRRRCDDREFLSIQSCPRNLGRLTSGTRSPVLGRLAVWLLTRRSLMRTDAMGGITATSEGIKRASPVVRGHRLWETYLAKHLEKDPDKVHAAAHRAEHFLSLEIQDRLVEESGVRIDPHGRPIPPRE